MLSCKYIVSDFEKVNGFKYNSCLCSPSQSPDMATQTKALQEQRVALEKEVVELKKQLEEQTKVILWRHVIHVESSCYLKCLCRT